MKQSLSRANIVLITLILAFGFWFLESLIEWYWFGSAPFGRALLPTSEPSEIWMRTVVVLLLIGIGVYANTVINRQRKMEAKLRREVAERQHTEHMLAANEKTIRGLYEISASASKPLAERIENILQLGCAHFNMPIGILASIKNDDYEVVHVVSPDNSILQGSHFPLGDTYCQITLREEEPVAFEYAAQSEWQYHPCYENFRLEAYMGTRVIVNDQVYGTLNFSSPVPLENRINPIDLDLLQLMAIWVSEELGRAEAEKELRLAASVFGNSNDGVIVTDANDKILRVNQAFTDISGYSADEVKNKRPRLLCLEQQKPEFYQYLDEMLQNHGRWQGEVTHGNKNGQTYPVWESISAVKDESGAVTNYVYIFSDISLIKQAEEKLKYLAHHDPLTGLPNRLMLYEHLEQVLERAREDNRNVTVLFIDLDGFKAINDKFGHKVGDQLLINMAKRLQACEAHNDIIARYGGDEFALVLDRKVTHKQVVKLAEEIIGQLSRPLDICGMQLNISASIGISVYPHDAKSASDLIEAADMTMYQSKKKGRNQFQFYSANRGSSTIRGQLA